MHNFLKNIKEYISSFLFPEENTDIQKDADIEKIIKIKKNLGDQSSVYPCPAYSFFPYQNNLIKKMIWQLKYKNKINVADKFAKMIYDQVCEELDDLAKWQNFTNPVLIPIPISKKRLRARGYNQSVAICKALVDLDENRFFTYNNDVLYKIKDTPSQAHVKDRAVRLKNLKDSFAIKDISFIKNKNIILIDDVLTTGGTLSEASFVLKSAGAKNIIWLVVAH